VGVGGGFRVCVGGGWERVSARARERGREGASGRERYQYQVHSPHRIYSPTYAPPTVSDRLLVDHIWLLQLRACVDAHARSPPTFSVLAGLVADG
jgi:hypothetical protein